ncbi:MAG: hypothetical protein J6U70_04895 [Bacteroidales bacterium]|jgi:hypothetical protein|nr:hypothetical protein [Bacteroidales bacterium]
MIKKLVTWYKEQTPTTQGMIWMGLLLIVGILLRWDYIFETIKRSFGFFSE